MGRLTIAALKGPPPMTLDEVSRVSLAYREFLAQLQAADPDDDRPAVSLAALSGDDSGPLAFDLVAIHRAALADPDCEHICQRSATEAARRWLAPRRFISMWCDATDAFEVTDDGRIMVDRGVALDYLIKRDERVMDAVIADHIARRKARAKVDPIGNAVESAKGGPFAMMFARNDARQAGFDGEDFAAAVMDRAKEQAGWMDEYAAETMMATVRRALSGG